MCGGRGIHIHTGRSREIERGAGRVFARFRHFRTAKDGFLLRFPSLGSSGCDIPPVRGITSRSQLTIPLISHSLQVAVSLCGYVERRWESGSAVILK